MNAKLKIADCPATLRNLPRWVFWRFVENKSTGLFDKIPKNPHGGGNASSTNPDTWGTLAQALDAFARFKGEGVGFVFAKEDGLVGIDLDSVRDPDSGSCEPWALDVITKLNSYTEVSQSGCGLHVITQGALPIEGSGGKKASIEMYQHSRYFCMTGNHVEGTPTEVMPRQAETIDLWTEHFADRMETPPGPAVNVALRLDAKPPSDRFEALYVNNERFALTWEHNRPDLANQSLSNYDLALCYYAAQANWTEQEMADLIVAHRRKYGEEKKAQRLDYIPRTVAKAKASFVLQDVGRSGSREEILVEVSKRFDFTIIGVQQLLCDPPEWSLLTEEYGKVILGEANNLRIFSRFQTILMGKCKRILRIKPVDWLNILDLLLKVTEDVPAEEATDVGLVTDLLFDYCRERPMGAGKIIVDGIPGKPAVSLRHFQSWLQTRSGGNFQLNLKWISRTLKGMGFSRQTLTEGGAQRRAWLFPEGWNFGV